MERPRFSAPALPSIASRVPQRYTVARARGAALAGAPVLRLGAIATPPLAVAPPTILVSLPPLPFPRVQGCCCSTPEDPAMERFRRAASYKAKAQSEHGYSVNGVATASGILLTSCALPWHCARSLAQAA